jgi:hypothetical protein
VLTAADLDPIVADWIVRFEAKQKRQEELYGAVHHAYQTLSESQRNKLGERSDASAQRIWRVLYEHGAIRQRLVNEAPRTVIRVCDRVQRQLIALLRTKTSLDLAMVQAIGQSLAFHVVKGMYYPEPLPPEPQSPAKLRGDKEAEAAARRWVKSVDYERAIWGKRVTKTGQIISFSRL